MRRNWFVVAIVVGVVAIAVAALLSRVTDDSKSLDPAAWADSVCTSLSDWRSSITSLADVSGETPTPDVLREKLDDAESATQELVSELEELGPPETEAGDELEQRLDAAAADVQSSFEELEAAAQDALDAGSPSAFLQELGQLAPLVQQVLDAARTTLAELQSVDAGAEASAEIEQAFADADSCQELQADG